MRHPMISQLALFVLVLSGRALTQSPVLFTDITDAMQVRGYLQNGIAAHGHGAAMADINGDSLPDIYISNFVQQVDGEPAGLPDLLYLSHTGAAYSEHGSNRRVDDRYGPSGSQSVIFFDYNNDGLYDLFNATTGDANRLYKNLGGGWFEDVTTQAGIPAMGWGTRGVAAVDINRDGWLDLYCVNWASMEDSGEGLGLFSPQPNELYINRGNGAFVAEPPNGSRGLTFYNPEHAGSQGLCTIDVDNDGDMDLFVCRREAAQGPALQMALFEPENQIYNQLFINDGNGFFNDETVSRGLHEAGNDCNGAAFADLDNDGDLDAIVVPNKTSDENGGKYIHIFVNDGTGHFTRSAETGTLPVGWGYSPFLFDADNDGDLDLFIGRHRDDKSYANGFYLNDGSGNFTEYPATGLSIPGSDPRGGAIGDIDNDGDLDLYYVDANNQLSPSYRNHLFRNDSQNNNRWLKVHGRGPKGDLGAFGTKIWLFEQNRMDEMDYLVGYRQIQNGYAFLCQDDPVQHFGLAERDSIDLKIQLLDGTVLKASKIAANQRIAFSKPGSLTLLDGNGQTAHPGEPLPLPLRLVARDDFGNPVIGVPVTFSVREELGQIVEQQPVYSDQNGIVAAHYITGDAAGIVHIEAVSPLVHGDVVRFIAVGSIPLLRLPTHISVEGGDGQQGIVDKILADELTVKVRDEEDEPVGGAIVLYEVESGAGTIADANTYTTITDDRGEASAQWRLGQKAGSPQRVRAQVLGYPQLSCQFSASALPGHAYYMTLITGDHQQGAPGAVLAHPIGVTIQDSLGNPVAMHPVLFQISAGDAHFSGADRAEVLSDSLGKASVRLTLGDRAGSVSITCESFHDGIALVNAPILFTAVTVNMRFDPSRSTYALSTPVVAADGIEAVHISCALRDAESRPVNDIPILFHVSGSSNILEQTAVLTDTAGVVTATLRSTRAQVKKIWAEWEGIAVSDDSATVRFIGGAPVRLQKMAGDLQGARVNTPLADPLTVKVEDQYGNGVENQLLLTKTSDPLAHARPAELYTDTLGLASLFWQLGEQPEQSLEVSLASAPDLKVFYTAGIVPNRVPVITCPQDTTIMIGQAMVLQVTAIDPEGDPVELAATALPEGAAFSPQSGQFSWQPGPAQLGDHRVVFTAQDSVGGASESSTVFHVITTNQPPQFTTYVPQDSVIGISAGKSILFRISVADPDQDSLKIKWFLNGMMAGNGLAITILTSKPAVIVARVSDGIFQIEKRWRIEIDTGISQNPGPVSLTLQQNYPNPANPSTSIQFSLPNPGKVKLTLLNQTGQIVATLVDGMMGQGDHRIQWDGRDQHGRVLPSGLYHYILQADGRILYRKLLLVK